MAYQALPFGWSYSPAIFQTALADALAPTLDAVRRLGVAVVVYVDDVAVAADDPCLCVRAATMLMEAVRAAGWRVVRPRVDPWPKYGANLVT